MKDSYIFYTDKLAGEYRRVFDQVDLYVSTQNVDEPTREDRMGVLLDTFLSAQQAERPVESVVGKDLEAFCRLFCSDLDWRNGLFQVLDSLRTMAKILIFFSALDLLAADWSAGADFWTVGSDMNLGGYLLGFMVVRLLSALSDLAIRRLLFRRGKVSAKVLKALPWVLVVGYFVLFFLLVSSSSTDVLHCPAWVLLAVGAGYLAVYYPMNRRRLAADKRGKVRFADLVEADLVPEVAATMEKKFEKRRRRWEKKGKTLDLADFLDREERDCDRTDKSGWLYIAAPPVITALACLVGEFESVWDALLYAAILLVIEGAIMRFFWRTTRSGTKARRIWIAQKREELQTKTEE